MAGYSWESGMSNSAVDCYNEGLMPAGKIGKVPASLIKEYCEYREWHHTSSHFNMTEFYDREEVLATFGLIESEEYEVNPEAVKALKEFNEQKKGKPLVLVSRFKYLEWGGTRKHPYASEVQAKGTITIKGLTATIEIENGVRFQKRMTTNGFEIDALK